MSINLYHKATLKFFRCINQHFVSAFAGHLLCLLIVFTFTSIEVVRGYSGDETTAADSADGLPDPYMTKEFDIGRAGILKVFTVAGDIEVIRSTENKVRVELYVDRGYAFWSNTKNMDNYRIIMMKRGNEVIASVEKKSREASFFGDQMTFSYKIYVPGSISAELKTLGGNISLRGVCGNQAIKTSGGNIEVSDVSGHLQAFTSGGNIDISDSRGTIFGQTEGGNISVNRGEGEIRLRTTGGRIELEQISGAMLARAGGGDIRAHFLHIAEGVSLTTSAGNIELKAPPAEGYDLVMRGSRINFDPGSEFKGRHTNRLVEGNYKMGGVPINLSTNSGTVTLKIAGN